jgi:glycosyltransferase involved in cell wall biosynthesis
MPKEVKEILFYYPVFNLGGAERSTNKLMNAFLDRNWSVTLLLITGGGNYEYAIDNRVRVVYLRSDNSGSKFSLSKGVLQKLRNFKDLLAFGVQKWNEKKTIKRLSKNEFDAGIVSLTGLNPSVLLYKIKCKKVFHILRNDISKFDSSGSKKVKAAIRPFWKEIDQYICVAEKTKEALVERFPQVKDKTSVIYNLLQESDILEKAENSINPFLKMKFKSGIKVLTVCRLEDKAKAILRMITAHARLIEDNIDHTWYVVGEGIDRKLIEEKIADLNVQDSFILLGYQDNPYPYYKFTDVCATLSYYEGFCGTVNEAKIFGKPVVATDFSGIYEQVVSGENGLIVTNELQAIVDGMRRILTDGDLRLRLTNNYLPEEVRNDTLKMDRFEGLILS